MKKLNPKQEAVLTKLRVELGVYEHILGEDSFACAARAECKKRVKTYIARAHRLGVEIEMAAPYILKQTLYEMGCS